jgi:hypothetical protein
MADVPVLLHQGPCGLQCGAGYRVFPHDAFMKGLAVLKTCYQGHEKRLQWQLIPGGHRFGGEGIEQWFERWL